MYPSSNIIETEDIMLKYSCDPEKIRNRKDKSFLVIRPEKLDNDSTLYLTNYDVEQDYHTPLVIKDKSIVDPDEIKHLVIYNDIGYNEWFKLDDDDYCDFEDKKFFFYECLTMFQNLEILQMDNVELPEKVWIQFAQNCKYLKKLYILTSYDYNFEFTKKGLEALMRIPTLEEVFLEKINMLWFPEGPSNIKKLELKEIYWWSVEEVGEENVIKEYERNIATHTNLELLYIDTHHNIYTKKLIENLAQNCKNLKIINFSHYKRIENEEEYENLAKKILTPGVKVTFKRI